MVKLISRVAVLLVFWSVLTTVEPKKKQTFVISYSSGVRMCEDAQSQAFMDTSQLQAKRINETIAVLHGPFEHKTDMDGTIKVLWLVEKHLSSGNKEIMATLEVDDYCEEIKKKDDPARLTAQYFKAMNYTTCPVKAGWYFIDNLIADTKQLAVNAYMEGKYTLTFTYYQIEKSGESFLGKKDKKERLGCLTFDCTIEPSD